MRQVYLSLILFGTFLSLPGTLPHEISGAQKTGPTQAQANQRIKKVFFDSDRLWILALDGSLMTLDLRGGSTEVVAPDKYVFDIYRNSAKQLYLLAGASIDSPAMRVWQKTGSSWNAGSELQRDRRDAVLGLKEYRNGLLVLTQHNIYLQDESAKWNTVPVKSDLGGAYQTPFAVTENGYIYLGINLGEFGGGLLQVSIATGRVKRLVKKDKPDLCAGPLNPECDPVTGVIKDPANPSCVIASIGLRHFDESGRLIRVCNESISVVFSKSYKEIYSEEKAKTSDEKSDEYSTEAIFDLVLGEKDYWAVTGRGVYHFIPGTGPTFHAMPKLRTLSGLNLSDEIPNIIVISTNINWSHSLSGYTPLIAVKD